MAHALIVRKGRRGTGGFSLVDVVLALAVLAVGVLGVISLLVLLRARNEDFNASRQAYRACQEVMEWVLADAKSGDKAWIGKWNNQQFQPRKVFVLDEVAFGKTAPRFNGKKVGTEMTNCGRVTITDVSDPALPGTLYEIKVEVDTTGVTPTPIQTRLITRRSTLP